MAYADKLDELCRLLADHVPLTEARKRAGVSDKAYANWLEDKTIRTRIEAATRGALAPEANDGDERSPDDCSAFGVGPMARLLWLDAKLVERMFPPISAWWREALTQFYASGKRWFVARVGRRGGKSSTLCRVAVAEAIWTERELPPGTIGVFSVISVDMAEATDRIDTIEAILVAMGYRKVEGEPTNRTEFVRSTKNSRPRIALQDAQGHAIEFRVYPATISGVSGHTSIGSLCDEAAKWRDEKTAANPADQVLKSIMPAMATQRAAHLFLISSAFSTIDRHHDAINDGDDERQFVARLYADGCERDRAQRLEAARLLRQQASATFSAHDRAAKLKAAEQLEDSAGKLDATSTNVPTWIANPTRTIEETRTDEPDLDTWFREYASIPTGGGATYFFDHQTIDRCNVVIHVVRTPKKIGVGIDPGLESNSFACVVWGLDDDGAWLLDALELVPSPGAPLDDEASFTECAELVKRYDGKSWATDGHYIATARRVGAKFKLATIRAPNDNGIVFLDYRRELGKGKISTAGHGLSVRIARQIKGVMSEPMAKAKTRIIMPKDGSVHGDLASAAVRGWWALTHQNAKPLWLPNSSQSDGAAY
jgi:hypothetical protein